MIKPIQAILYILRGNLTLENKTVPVIKRNYPLDKTPCVNIDDSAGVVTVRATGIFENHKKNNTQHPLMDR